MSTTLTLGPVTLQLPLTSDGVLIRERRGFVLADCGTNGARVATLFAAAPDLLVAAEALMDIHSLGVLAFEDKAIADATDRLIHAIARARGKDPA